MRILTLDTPYVHDPGHGRKSVTFAKLAIIDIHADCKEGVLQLMLEYGNVVDGNWVASGLPPEPVTIRNKPHRFTGLDLDGTPRGIDAELDFDTIAGPMLAPSVDLAYAHVKTLAGGAYRGRLMTLNR